MARRAAQERSTAAARWKGDAPLRVLVGPYVHAGHCSYMVGAFDDFDTITFGPWEGSDIVIDGIYSIEDVLAQARAGWRCDLMLLWRPEYTTMPRGIEDAEFPVAMLISDWYVAFSDCLEAARFVNMVVTGTRGESVFTTAGFDHTIAMPMLGYQEGFDGVHASDRRDIDVFCAGNPNWFVHAEREKVNAKLLDLPEHVRFLHAPMVSREDYNRYLGRSKIFVNQTVIGEVNMKVYECTSAQVCLFVEEDNLDIRDYLVDEESVVLFNRENLNDKILYYLEHEEERLAIARAGHAAMRARSYRANMRDIVERLRAMGREELLTRGREILRARPERRALHYAGYMMRRPHYDLTGMIELTASLPESLGPRRDFLVAVAQYCAAKDMGGAREHCELHHIWKMRDVLAFIEDLWNRVDDDLCINLLWAQLAGQYRDIEFVDIAFGRLIAQLERPLRIPLSGEDLYVLPEKRGFVFERLAWEKVERSAPPDDVLRRFLLEYVHGRHADALRGAGRRIESIEALRRAVEANPRGGFSRPMLAQDLRDVGEYDEAARVLREHLTERPLDLRSAIASLEVDLRRQDLEAARVTLLWLTRFDAVFVESPWAETIAKLREHFGSLLEVGVGASAST